MWDFSLIILGVEGRQWLALDNCQVTWLITHLILWSKKTPK